MVTIHLNVDSVTCNSSVQGVIDALQPIRDITNLMIDSQAGIVEVQRTLNKSDDLIAALNERGFRSNLVADMDSKKTDSGRGVCCCG